VELETDGKCIQVECSFNSISGDDAEKEAWNSFRKTLHEGDHWCMFYSTAKQPANLIDAAFSGTSKPDTGLTGVAKYTLKATQLPTLLSPCLHQIPEEITDPNTLTSFPQLSLMINNQKTKLLKFRHLLERGLESHLEKLGFISATTPILAGTTGGATANPFVTSSKYLPDSSLKLRIATELDLKMLITAGIPRVYELGRVFRNEGLDAVHNPEFTTCEFYMAYANLNNLVDITESLMLDLRQSAEKFFGGSQLGAWTRPFPVIDFISTLESQIRNSLPNFRFPKGLPPVAPSELLDVCTYCNIAFQDETPSTAHILDLLASRFLEPLTKSSPSFIAYHPAITSPLSKSFVDPKSGHEVSARMELFVNGTEYANFYEEENDPLEQMRKFWRQDITRSAECHDIGVDSLSYERLFERLSSAQKYYIRVIEMGMPPTAGWGAGIDRLVMLFGGAERISEVLPFGNLRHVLAMGIEM
jgi:lysyl-tRNA synthetase, class II